MDSLYYFCWLIAVQVPPGGGSAGAVKDAAATASDAANGGGGLGGLGFFLPAMLMVMVLYFMLMMPKQQQKETAERADLLANLKKNDRIVTAGGILGTVVNNRDDTEYMTIRVDDSTKMQILKASVVRVLKDDDHKSNKS